MAEIITFPPKAEPKPQDDCVCVIPTDGKPVKWFRFGCTFKIDDSEFGFDIWALDAQDAERRIAAVRETATVDGQIFGIIPA